MDRADSIHTTSAPVTSLHPLGIHGDSKGFDRRIEYAAWLGLALLQGQLDQAADGPRPA
jgi:hypothetical protein